MSTISIKYSLVWRFVKYPYIQISSCRKIFNVKNNKQLKCCLNGGSLGYWIAKDKFVPLSKINKEVEKIPKNKNIQL